MKKQTKIFLIAVMMVGILGVFSCVNAAVLVNDSTIQPSGVTGTETGGFSMFMVWVYRLALSSAAILAVFMIIIGGVQFILSGANESLRTSAKTRIEQALWGLLLALLAYLILWTINPDLIKEGFQLDPVGQNIPAATLEPGALDTSFSGGGSFVGNLKSIYSPGPNGVPIKSGICGGSAQSCKLDEGISNKLGNLNAKLMSNGFGQSNWQVTEGYPPTYTHKSPCHNNGTCFDANFVGSKKSNPTVKDINDFNNASSQSGLQSTYEVTSKSQYDQLVKDGAISISYNPDASGNHFHVIDAGGSGNW